MPDKFKRLVVGRLLLAPANGWLFCNAVGVLAVHAIEEK